MKPRIWILVIGICLGFGIWLLGFPPQAEAAIYKYNFPKPSSDWGKPISFTNLSPGFFQVMYQDKIGIVRIATYGIAGASMDTLKDPQLLMVFVFDQPSSANKTVQLSKR